MLTSSSYVVLALPLFVTLLSGWFCHKGLSAAFNALISLIIIFGSALLYTRIIGPLIGGQIASLMIVAAYCAALIAWPLKSLHQWFVLHMLSPFAGLASITISIQRQPVQRTQWQPTPVPSPHSADTTPEIPIPLPSMQSSPSNSLKLSSPHWQERMQP